MNNELHRLLKRQLKKYFGLEGCPPGLADFIQAVNDAYREYENNLRLMERSIEISSREYGERTLELQEAEESLSTLVETVPAGIMIISADGVVSFVNSAVERIFSCSRQEMVGQRYDAKYWYSKNARGVLKAAAKLPVELVVGTGEAVIGLEYAITDAGGLARILYVNAAPLHYDGEQITEVVVSLEDITQRKNMENQLKFLSLHDALTGLYNRAYFEEEMRRLGNGRYNPVGIIVCDIDGLKLVNDTLGHEKGDELLLAAADILVRCFRADDVVARIGGDEFAVLLPAVRRKEVEQLCDKLREAVEMYNDNQSGNQLIPLAISAGFAVGSPASLDLADLFKEADNNMYREKLHHHQSARSSIVQTLLKALGARDFCTEGHGDRMRELAKDLGKAAGLGERKIADLVLLAQFHDIGKVGIPDRILFKPGPLNDEERQEMRRHCEIGHRIACSAPDLVLIADWILKHHEWWDGSGYPLGLRGREIPLECRILAIVDAYDAMTSDRPYRKALAGETAIAELKRCAGTQFDPDLVLKFINFLKAKELSALRYGCSLFEK